MVVLLNPKFVKTAEENQNMLERTQVTQVGNKS